MPCESLSPKRYSSALKKSKSEWKLKSNIVTFGEDEKTRPIFNSKVHSPQKHWKLAPSLLYLQNRAKSAPPAKVQEKRNSEPRQAVKMVLRVRD